MTFRLIDTIELREGWTHRYPDLAARGEGVLVVLEPEGPRPDALLAGRSVTVRRPDGSIITPVVDRVERGAGDVPGLFFRGLSAADIPRGSTIEDL
jgi:hypothetical protein